MKYLNFANGDQMPALGLGTWKSAPGEVHKVILKAIELGYRHFDCAYIYGNEREIGQAFSDAFSAGSVKREDLWITSKLWNNKHRQEQVKPAIINTLDDLRLGYLDLYLIHWPVVVADEVEFPSKKEDLVSLTVTPLEETWTGMIDLKKAGLSRHIGVSNFNPSHLNALSHGIGVAPEMNQVEMHPHLQQKALKEYCDEENILMTAYSPLGSGDRPKNRKKKDEPNLLQNPSILEIAEEKSCSPAQVILAWEINRGTAVIPKSVNEKRLAENLAAADIDLSDVQMKAIANIDQNYRFIDGTIWCLPGSDYTLEELWG